MRWGVGEDQVVIGEGGDSILGSGPGLGCWTRLDPDLAGHLSLQTSPRGDGIVESRWPKAKLMNVRPWVEPRIKTPASHTGSVCKKLSQPVPVVVKDEEMK